MNEPLTDERLAELRRLHKSAEPKQFARLPVPQAEIDEARLRKRDAQAAALVALPRLLDELQERRAQASAHVTVMDVAHDYATVMRDWNARARAVLNDLPPVGRGDQVTIPRELYERLLALK